MTDMHKLILYCGIAFLIGISCDKNDIGPKQADAFVKYYGGLADDHGSDVKQLPGGGYFIFGTIMVGDNSDIFTLVTDKYGNSKYALKSFDGANLNDRSSRMQLLSDGGAIAIGTYQRALGNNDIWILRFNNQGDTIWTKKFGKSYGDDEGYDLIINEANEIIAVGYTDRLSTGGIHDKQIWIYAVGLNGDNIWQNERNHGFPEKDEVANGILEVDNGFILICSEKQKYSTSNILLLKTDIMGINYSNIGEITSDDDEKGNMITTLPDGNFMILGTKTNVSNNTSDILLIKINGSFKDNEKLEILDEKILDNGENEIASCFLYRNNQIHILGSSIESRTNTRKILLVVTDESGNNSQFLKYGFKNEIMEGYGMDYTSDGGYVFTGSNLVLFKIKDTGEL
jgi:hypothetical protein